MWYEVTLESSVTVTVEAENEEQAAQRAKDAAGDFDIQNALEENAEVNLTPEEVDGPDSGMIIIDEGGNVRSY